ncbi:MAG: acyltransferase [Caldilineaceae bacterium]
MKRLWQLLHSEIREFHPRLQLAQIAMSPLPPHVGSRLRVSLLRLIGFRIGRGTVMWGAPTITGSGDLYKRLTVGESCWFNVACFLNLGAEVWIGNRVSIGHQVMILTETHAVGAPYRRAGLVEALPVTIEDGVWLGARCTILPGVTIGTGAVVAAGAVVTKAVAPHTLVGGVPARPLRELLADTAVAHNAPRTALPQWSKPTMMTKEASCETL